MDLKINVKNLPREGSNLEIHLKEEDISIKEIVGDMYISFNVSKNGNSYDVKGFMEYELSLTCSRCLEEISRHNTEEFNLEFKEKKGYSVSGKLAKKMDEADTEFVVKDGLLDLGAFIHDEAILSIPLKPLCSERCKGLCTICGVNLNETTCEHSKLKEKSLT